jgi:hypothetical protein
MKHFFILYFIFILTSCNKDHHEQGCAIAVVRDVTDSKILAVQTQPILELFNLGEHKSESAYFRYSEIRDVSLVPVTTFYLPDAGTSENKKNAPMFREKLILNFYNSIRNTISRANVKADSSLLGYSECFRTISNELNILAQNKSSTRILIVFSNLFEHSKIWSIYSTSAHTLLYKHPEEVQEIFENSHLLPDHLSGITTVIVYQPKNREDDQLFNAIVEIYKRLIQARGGKIIIQATNLNYSL